MQLVDAKNFLNFFDFICRFFLAAPHLSIAALGGDQFIVCALLDDAARIQN